MKSTVIFECPNYKNYKNNISLSTTPTMGYKKMCWWMWMQNLCYPEMLFTLLTHVFITYLLSWLVYCCGPVNSKCTYQTLPETFSFKTLHVDIILIYFFIYLFIIYFTLRIHTARLQVGKYLWCIVSVLLTCVCRFAVTFVSQEEFSFVSRCSVLMQTFKMLSSH